MRSPGTDRPDHARHPGEADPRLRPARRHDAVRGAGGRHRPGRAGVPIPASSSGVLRFLKQVTKAYPRRKLHLVVDNYATHKQPAVKAWLAPPAR